MSDPAPELELRRDLDASGRAPALIAFTTAVFWLLFGTLVADVVSLKFQLPDWWTGQAWLSFGRLRPVHLNAVIYGWSSLGMLGVSLWLVPRLVRTPLRWARLALVGIGCWNVGLVVGIAGLLVGYNDGLEWLELHRWFADPWLVVGGAMVGGALLRTLVATEVDHLYVSVWYVAGAFIWFPMLFVVGNWPWTGVESAGANWFFGHNALGFWISAINLGAVYYFIPKVLGRPVYSYQLSLLGFWSFTFFYSLNGMHHLIGGPMPTWMITTSIVASLMMVIPVTAVAINHHMTMVGRFGSLRYSPTLRFVVLGAIAYTAVSLQGTFTAFREVNRITHFTHWTIGHSHMGVYAFATLVLFGSMYYILPRLVRRDWPSGVLISWHFWLTVGGIAVYILALTVGGVVQGLALLDPARPFEDSVRAAAPWLLVRTLSGFVITIGHFVFAWHVWRMLRAGGAGVERRMPPWHETPPIVVTRGGP